MKPCVGAVGGGGGGAQPTALNYYTGTDMHYFNIGVKKKKKRKGVLGGKTNCILTCLVKAA